MILSNQKSCPQTMEITDKVVLCVNLMDEAQKKKIRINLEILAARLGIPVVGTSARSGRGLDHLMNAVSSLTENSLQVNPLFLTYSAEIEK
ncbi:FeoB small GTPase domain-containing protein, partial [Desulfosporosinus sp. PR]|uniref:FeoB small GTPase domain-containing protein n=1 Tax=Candidatus Desulfosporosinus nitrosoreducens TaxID=3401928 RepID=UPI0027F1A04D